MSISEKYEQAENRVKEINKKHLWVCPESEPFANWIQENGGFGSEIVATKLAELERERAELLVVMADEYNNWTDGFQRMQPVELNNEELGKNYDCLVFVNKDKLKSYQL